MSMNRDFSMQNGLIDPVTLTFDLLIPKAYHFEYIPSPVPSLNTLGSFVSELRCGQTDRQTDKQTNKQTEGLENLTHAARHSRHG